MRGERALLLAAFICIARSSPAQQTDVKGSRDHPLIPRYAGSSIIGYGTREFDELTLALGKSVADEEAKGFESKLSKSQRVEGKLTRLLYVAPLGRSSLEVFRNYETALKNAGFQPLFSCNDGECDHDKNASRFDNLIYSSAKSFENGTSSSGMAFTGAKEVRYLAAKLSAPGKDVYASLMVAIEGFDHFKDTFNHPLALLEVIETKAMETNMVKVDADTMAKDIVSTGRAVLYGIYFDTGKDVIKPESEPALAEIGKLLKQDRNLKLYVVGHTDNEGGFDSNMDLSNRRANSVVGHLRTRYGVEAIRLRPVGVGFLAPVASNESDDGRSKNRRVELVKQ
jgi:OmpA-OmpF porin, OOP family